MEEKPQISFFDNLLGKAKQAAKFAEVAADKVQHISRSNVEMGLVQMRQGQFFDAAIRFKIASVFDKNNAIALYLLGKTQIYRGKKAKAIAPLQKALSLNPKLTEANFLLATCGAGQNFTEIPRSFIIERADIIADNYDKIFIEGQKTNFMSKLESEFAKYFESWQGFDVLDLNCQAGDVGAIIKPKANVLVGVDASIKMAALARKKRVAEALVYNKVAGKFPEDYLAENPENYQLIMAMHYLSNFAALDKFFALVRTKMAASGGAFVFTATPTKAEKHSFLTDRLIFCHSEAYVTQSLTDAGFKLVHKAQITYESGLVDNLYFAEVG